MRISLHRSQVFIRSFLNLKKLFFKPVDKKYLHAGLFSLRAKVFLSLILLAPFCFLSCAGKQSSKKSEPELVRQAEPLFVDQNQSPRRVASLRLVEKGIEAINAEKFDRAEQLFQNAMNVDPQNGIAYFYAAKISVLRVDVDRAEGFLDKAEVLIGHDEYWSEMIAELRAEAAGEY